MKDDGKGDRNLFSGLTNRRFEYPVAERMSLGFALHLYKCSQKGKKLTYFRKYEPKYPDYRKVFSKSHAILIHICLYIFLTPSFQFCRRQNFLYQRFNEAGDMLAACYLPQPPLTEVGDIFCRVIKIAKHRVLMRPVSKNYYFFLLSKYSLTIFKNIACTPISVPSSG